MMMIMPSDNLPLLSHVKVMIMMMMRAVLGAKISKVIGAQNFLLFICICKSAGLGPGTVMITMMRKRRILSHVKTRGRSKCGSCLFCFPKHPPYF